MQAKSGDNMVTFDITTGAAAAQAVIDGAEKPKEEVKEEAKTAPPAPVKKKLNRHDFIFKDKKGETLIKRPGDINGIDFVIKNLEDCKVYLLDHIAQL